MWSSRVSVILSCGTLFIYHRLQQRFPDLNLSTLSSTSTIILSLVTLIILFASASTFARELYESYRAKRLGALRIPKLEGWLPGNIDTFFWLSGRLCKPEEPGETFVKLHEKLGPLFSVRFFGSPITVISTIDPSHMQRILAGNFDNYGKSPIFLDVMKDILGEGVFNSDQKGLWKWHRTITRPHFARSEVFNYPHFQPYANRLIDYFVKNAKSQTPIDAQDAYGLFTSDSGTSLFFGKDFRSLDKLSDDPDVNNPEVNRNLKDGMEFWKAFLNSQAHGITRLRRNDPVWKWFELFGWMNPNKKNARIISKNLDSLIEEAIKSSDSHSDGKDSDSELKKETLLMHLIGETQDVKLIRDELLNILIAARDTTASLLTSITHELARNPEAFKKLRAEIVEAVGEDPSHIPTYEEMKGCKYTYAVIHETLRMWPPGYINARFAYQEDIWEMDGRRYYIPAQSVCRYHIGLMQKLKNTWGPDAEEWIPERWLDERIKYMTNNPFVFQPFSAGPRICLGQKFALNETTFALARMLQRITSISLAPDAQPSNTILPNGAVSKQNVFILSSRGGLWVRFGTDEQ